MAYRSGSITKVHGQTRMLRPKFVKVGTSFELSMNEFEHTSTILLLSRDHSCHS